MEDFVPTTDHRSKENDQVLTTVIDLTTESEASMPPESFPLPTSTIPPTSYTSLATPSAIPVAFEVPIVPTDMIRKKPPSTNISITTHTIQNIISSSPPVRILLIKITFFYKHLGKKNTWKKIL